MTSLPAMREIPHGSQMMRLATVFGRGTTCPSAETVGARFAPSAAEMVRLGAIYGRNRPHFLVIAARSGWTRVSRGYGQHFALMLRGSKVGKNPAMLRKYWQFVRFKDNPGRQFVGSVKLA
jgi:hypothetical protein